MKLRMDFRLHIIDCLHRPTRKVKVEIIYTSTANNLYIVIYTDFRLSNRVKEKDNAKTMIHPAANNSIFFNNIRINTFAIKQ